jgi:tetratricopeptide (TPR) repeat protein
MMNQEALSLLQRASGLRSDLPKAWKALGDVYEGQRRWEEAIQATEVKREGGREGGRVTMYLGMSP